MSDAVLMPEAVLMSGRRAVFPCRRHDSGYVTAETAVVMPVFALLLGVALWAMAVAAAQVRCIDAARDAARALARGESVATASAAAREATPSGSTIAVRQSGDRVVVVVTASVGKGFGPLAAIATPTVSATAIAQSEDDS
jgi:Flp pilus assembly protein TadG